MNRVGIFYDNNTKVKAEKLFDNMVEQFNPDKIRVIKGYNKTFMTTDYFYIQLVRASDSARGYRWNKVYVPREISEEIIQNIIEPKCINIPQRF